jgi:virginiamycin B lyase
MKFQKASLFVAIALAMSAGANLAYSQEFVQVTTSSLTQIAVGGQSVWGLNASGQIFQFNPTTQKFTQVPGQLTSIAVGGGTLGQPEEVWGINGREILRFNPQDLPAGLFEQIPGQLSRISVGPGYEPCHQAEVWGINASGDIYRFNYCANSFFQVPGILAQIAVGDSEVWGINSALQVYRFNFQTGTFDQVPGLLVAIATGGGQVWGLNLAGSIFRLDRNTGTFTQVPGVLAHISVGGNGVWGVNFSDAVYRFDESSQGFVQVNGVLTAIAVGSGVGVWGLDANHAFVFRAP